MRDMEVAETLGLAGIHLPVATELPGDLPGMSAPPVIARIAGLPGEILLPFLAPACSQHWEAQQALAGELAKARSRLVDLLAEAIPGFSPALRGSLLTIKRDCFNGRSLRKCCDRPEWAEVLRLSEGLAERIVALEERLDESQRTFAALYERELARERRHILGTLQNVGFLRGMALGGSDFIAKARALAENPEVPFGRRERKIEQTLLRFITRTAAKLSPYSTLTAIALCTVREDTDHERFRFTDAQAREISLVRVNRALLDQCLEVLLRHPSLRGACQVALNDTIREVEPGRYRFLRNGHWSLDPEKDRYRFVPASHVSVRLSGPLLAWVCQVLAGGPLSYHALLAELEHEHASGELEIRRQIDSGLDRLFSLGLLDLLPPWPTHETYLEKRLLDVLRTLDEDPALADLTEALERLVELERSHAWHPAPERSIADLDTAVTRFLACVERLAGGGRQTIGRGVYEDVFLMPQQSRPADGELLQISRGRVRDLMADAELVSRFACLYNHRHDLMHTLAAFWAERWPQRREIAFLDFFQELSPLWTSYLRFDLTERYDNFSSFNPLRLESIDRLNELRKDLMEKACTLVRPSALGTELPPEPFAALLDEIPERYRPLLGSCLFTQPADPRGDFWVLNRLFEGSGRYISRYGAIMEEPMRQRFTGHLAARSTVEIDGEPADLLDLMFTSGSMVNLRVPQTAKVLEMPGERIDLPAARRVRLSDLRVQVDLQAASLRLTDARGRRLLPVHMSSMNNVFLPVIIRLLSVFGPFETRQIFPRPPFESAEEVNVASRLACGNLVIRRKRWEVTRQSLPEGLPEAPGAEAFRQVQGWRRAVGLPSRVFLYEQMHRDGGVQSFKPQYLDFGSPSLVSLFLSIAKKKAERLLFEEPLPLFTKFPLDGAGALRAFELQIDSLALRTP